MTAKVTVEGRVLAAALKQVTAVIERRNTIPILSTVLLRIYGGQLHLVGTDLDLEIGVAVDVIDFEPGTIGCIGARTLYSIVRQAGALPVTIRPVEIKDPTDAKGKTLERMHAEINVADGDAVHLLDLLPAEDFPFITTDILAPLSKTSNGQLAEAFAVASLCISTEETRYYLNGLNWSIGKDEERLTATDGHRLASTKLGAGEGRPDMSIIVPRKTVKHIESFAAGKNVTVAASDRFIRFVYDNVIILSKLIDGTFPDWRLVVPIKREGDIVLEFDADRLREAIMRVVPVASQRGRAVRLNVQEGAVMASVKSADIGTVTARTFGKPSGEKDISLGFNSGYLLSFLGKHHGSFKMQSADNGSPCTIEIDGSDALFVLMPMRV